MKKVFFSLFCLIIFLNNSYSCTSAFSFTESGVSSLFYDFASTSGGFGDLKYTWNFGDTASFNNIDTTSGSYTNHFFSVPGIYVISLIIEDTTGCIDTSYATISVIDKAPCSANFYPIIDTIDFKKYEFIALNTDAIAYSWNFDDPSTGSDNFSTNKNATHTFSDTGWYQVQLVVDSGCKDTFIYPVYVFDYKITGCFAAFNYISDTANYKRIHFYNRSYTQSNRYELFWDFGDGSTNSSDSVVSHEYADTGVYEVQLIIKEIQSSCTDTAMYKVLVFDFSFPVFCEYDDFGYIPTKKEKTIKFIPYNTFFGFNPFTGSEDYKDTLEWDFGDGSSALGTNPIHTYQDTGSYLVCVTTRNHIAGNVPEDSINAGNISSDTSGGYPECKLNICRYAYVGNKTSYSVSGTAYQDSTEQKLNKGKVYLTRFYSELGILPKVDSVNIGTNGTYTFNKVQPGVYYVWVKPDTIDFKEYLPTYFGDKVFWFKAQELFVNSNIDNIDIGVIKKPTIAKGSGIIRGIVRESKRDGKFKITGPGDPFNGVDVSLIDKSTNNPIANSTSGSSGNRGEYIFTEVPNGDYTLYVDVAGVDVDTNYIIEVSDQKLVNNIDVTIDSAGITFEEDTVTVSIDEITTSKITGIYPNPFKNDLTVVYNKSDEANIRIAIYDILGKLLLEELDDRGYGMYKKIFSLDKLNKGIYFVKLSSVSINQQIKVIKQ